jgi:hypothetical protein
VPDHFLLGTKKKEGEKGGRIAALQSALHGAWCFAEVALSEALEPSLEHCTCARRVCADRSAKRS